MNNLYESILAFQAYLLPLSFSVLMAFVMPRKLYLGMAPELIVASLTLVALQVIALVVVSIARLQIEIPWHSASRFLIAIGCVALILNIRLLVKTLKSQYLQRYAYFTAPSLIIVLSCVLGPCLFGSHPWAAWDALDVYIPDAVSLIENLRSDDDRSPWQSSYVHPPAISALAALVFLFDDNATSVTAYWLFNFYTVLLLVLAVLGIGRNLRLSGVETGMLMLVGLMMPLVGNHLLLPGYLDYWVAINCLLAVSVIVGIFSHPANSSVITWGIVCILMFCMIWWKNSWPMYMLSVAVPLLYQALGNRYHARGLVLLVLLVGFVMWPLLLFLPGSGLLGVLAALGLFEVPYLGPVGISQMKWGWEENPYTLWVGGKEILLQLQSPRLVGQTFVTALYKNSSFTIMGVVYLIALVSVCRSEPLRSNGGLVAIGTPSMMLVFFVIICFISPKFLFEYSAPGSDTGLSRFLQAWALSVIPALGLMLSSVSEGPAQPFDGEKRASPPVTEA